MAFLSRLLLATRLWTLLSTINLMAPIYFAED